MVIEDSVGFFWWNEISNFLKGFECQKIYLLNEATLPQYVGLLFAYMRNNPLEEGLEKAAV